MGLFDLPRPVLAAMDSGMAAVLPAGIRLVIWALIGSVVSMLLYRWISPQERIARLKVEVVEARRALDGFEGEFSEAGPLLKRMLGVSLRHVGVVFGPAVLASLPLLCLLVWMSTAYGYVMPVASPDVPLHVAPDTLQAHWQSGGGASGDAAAGAPHIEVTAADGAVVGGQDLTAAVPTVHKYQWWNALIGNPVGYVPDNAPYDRVDIDLARRTYLPVGPDWLRSWEAPFFAILIVSSLLIKIVFRVQ